MKGLAKRRHEAAKRKAKAVRKIRARFNWTPPEGIPRNEDPVVIGMTAATPKPCSCWACGNPRHHFGDRTMAEKRADDDLKHQIGEVFSA